MSVNTKVNGQLVPSAGLYKVSVPIQSGDIYSFEERQVGVWTDGKPLYQKTVYLSALPSTLNTFVDYPHGIANIDDIVNIDGVAVFSTGNTAPINYVVSNLLTGQIGISANATNILIMVGSDRSSVSAYVTLQYTKTTDVAGSGKYVPSGDKAEHYSANEEVIGTFLGETLYRKTINFGALPNTTLKNVAHGISNIGYIKSYEGTAYNPTNGYYISLPYLHSSVSNNDVEIYFNDTNASIVTKADRSAYTTCYITLEYTKTS